MNVALVHPPLLLSNVKHQLLVQPPLGMAYVAACLRQAGHAVQVVDGVGEAIGRRSPFRDHHHVHGLPIDEIVARVAPGTEAIGIGVMFSNFWPVAKALIHALRARFPGVPIFCGGEHVSALPHVVLQQAPADYAVIGEGEETAVELLAALAGHAGAPPLERIAGLAYRGAGGAIVTTARRRRRAALDEIPWPAWELFPLEHYLDARLFSAIPLDSAQRPMVIVGTRGCPYTCKFCSNEQMWGINYFMRDPARIVDEMAHYVARYGATDFHFQDLTLVINAAWTARLCEEIVRRDLRITWKTISGTRSEALDGELLALMARSGCDDLVLAPESGSPEMSRVTRKRVQLEKVLAVGRTLQAVRPPVRLTALMIIGYPEERLRDVLQTFGFLMRMARAGFSTIHVHRFTAYPGCEYHDIAVRERRITHDDAYFLSLENTFPFNDFSWHPRWSGRFIAALITLGFCLFYASYYGAKPAELARALWNVLTRRPHTRFERYFAYRIWGAPATQRAASGAPAAHGEADVHSARPAA